MLESIPGTKQCTDEQVHPISCSSQVTISSLDRGIMYV